MTSEIALERTTTPRLKPQNSDLGFGRYFADHMFSTEYSIHSGWHDYKISPYQNLSIEPTATVLHYGQAIFEGLKAFWGVDGQVRLFRPEMNWKRMQRSAERLCMQMIPQELFIDSLKKLIQTDFDWIPREPGTALYLRPTLIGTEGFLGVRPSEKFLYFVITSPVGGYYGVSSDPIKIWIEPKFSRAATGGIGEAKAGGNYAASLYAAVEAKKKGFSQVLWLDAAQHSLIEEVGTMNVFFRLGDGIVTPPLGGTILPGVTRDSVIHLLKDHGISVEERPISITEIIAAHKSGELKEVFGTGTAASISPVGELGMNGDKMVINDHKIGDYSQLLWKSLTDIQYGRTTDNRGWTNLVKMP